MHPGCLCGAAAGAPRWRAVFLMHHLLLTLGLSAAKRTRTPYTRPQHRRRPKPNNPPPPFCPRFFSLAYEPPRGAYVGVKRDDAFLARGDCRSASSKAIRMQSEASAWNALNQAGAGKGPASFGGGCEALRGAARVLIVLCVAYREIRAARLLPARPLLLIPLPFDRLSRTHTRSDTGVGSFFFHTPASHWAFQRAYSSRHQPTRPGSSHGIIRPANKSPRAQPSIQTPLR